MREGWKTFKLEQVSDFQGGSQPPKSQFIDEPREGYIRLLQIRDFKSDHRAVYIPLTKKNRTCLSDDIMIGRYGASVGQIHRGKSGAYNVALIKTIPNENIIGKGFFYLYLISDLFQRPLSSVADRSAQDGFSKSDIAPFEIMLPPLPEQKRIVSILDEAFEGIDRAVANAEKNLANAKELFESYLNKVFTEKGEGWSEVMLSDICDVRDGTHDSPKYVEDGIPFVTQKNIGKNGLNFEKTKFISVIDHKKFYKRSNVSEGDILISMIGANRGMSCLVNDSRVFSIKNVGLIKSTEHANMRYLLYYLKSKLAKKYVEAESKGGAQLFIGLKKLRDFPISLAPIDIQESVVMKMSQLGLETQRLEAIYQQKLDSLAELKQSLLQKAFSGELTADVSTKKEAVA
jgi:type I restriction enzyme, S subunit